MPTTDVITIIIEGCSDKERARLTTAMPGSKKLIRLIGPGKGPHRIEFEENLDGSTTVTGRSGKLTTSIVVTPEAELS